MWTFDYRTFWNPGDPIRVWYGDVIVGELHHEAAARELQARLQGASIGTGDGDPPPASVPLPPAGTFEAEAQPDATTVPSGPPLPSFLPADPAPEPAPESTTDPSTPPTDTTELLRVTCAGPLHNAICEVVGYQGNMFRVRVVSDGAYLGDETTLDPDQCVPHAGSHA